MKNLHPDLPPKAQAVTHYENFPVASWLCPRELRQPIAAIYAFARHADDIADEGQLRAAQRLELLANYRHELHRIATANVLPHKQWAAIFAPLQYAITRHHLPLQLLDDLLSAFEQDIEKNRDQSTYADRSALLDYCRRSANPVGRLLLHLYGVHDPLALAQSDAICTALQLINFWQDLSEDIPRGRHYLTDADCLQFGVSRGSLAQKQVTPAIQKLITANIEWARHTMYEGVPLVHALPGRIGWELRFVVQGGLCILNKVERQQGGSLHTRQTVRKHNLPLMVWKALRM